MDSRLSRLYAFTDHKPLAGLLKTVNLYLVGTSRLLDMLEGMLRWRFSVTLTLGEKQDPRCLVQILLGLVGSTGIPRGRVPHQLSDLGG